MRARAQSLLKEFVYTNTFIMVVNKVNTLCVLTLERVQYVYKFISLIYLFVYYYYHHLHYYYFIIWVSTISY